MKLEESDKLDSDIQFLSNALVAGFNKCQAYKRKASDKGLVDKKLEKFIKEVQTELQKWYVEVMQYLIDNLDRNYHQYHFSAHKTLSTIYSNMNEKVSNSITAWEGYLRNLEDIIFRLEDAKNLQVRREIAEIENQADIAYEIRYNDHKREITINNIIIAKPDFESENERFFTYVYANSNRPIPIKEIEDHWKVGKLKKRVTHIVDGLGFSGALREIFFPVVKQDKVMFVNPISKKQVIEKSLPAINFAKLEDMGRHRKPKEGKAIKK